MLAETITARPIPAPTFTAMQARMLARLEVFPTWALEEAVSRRRFKTNDAAVRLPDLLVDPVGCRIVYHGTEYALTGRAMELVYALAVARVQGHWRVPAKVLARKLYRNFTQEEGIGNVRSYVWRVNRRIVPGLILLSGGQNRGFGLNVPEVIG